MVTMKRDIYRDLQAWRDSKYRKPLVLCGARQTGKTYILQQFGEREYRQCHYFNFEEDSRLASLFEGNLDTGRIIRDLSIYQNRDIRREEHLIIFDEVQACNAALSSLKYFNEHDNDYHIASAGSLLGVRISKPRSFPVGKVDFLDLYPMTFFEFLDAVGENRYRSYLEGIDRIAPLPGAFHDALIGLLQRYYLVGGMPEAVNRHTADPGFRNGRAVQKSILDSFTLDFAKHAPSSDIPKLSLVWESLPSQLARENKKFLFSVVKEGARAREYENALTWLTGAGLIHRSVLVTTPKVPLKAYRDASSFKIYACDVGLLGALADVPGEAVQSDLSVLTEYHGAFVENYVAQHLAAMTGIGLHYWKNAGRAAEIDFLLQHGPSIVPLEAKSGMNLRSKSLAVYAAKYRPPLVVRTSLRNLKIDDRVLNVPLYALQSLPQILDLL
ncbi:MAG: ATP-binding protein [Spirochaetaceae bacterium]|nr:ATP-binding protein [Spirochaetaceae bacterium]